MALASGQAAHSVLEVVAGGADGSELAVVAPVAPALTWFVVVAWQRAETRPEAVGPVRDGPVVWLERPRRDERTGHVSWTFAGSTRGSPTVNQHVQIASRGGAVLVTLVSPVEELAEGRRQLERIVGGLGVEPPPLNAKRR